MKVHFMKQFLGKAPSRRLRTNPENLSVSRARIWLLDDGELTMMREMRGPWATICSRLQSLMK